VIAEVAVTHANIQQTVASGDVRSAMHGVRTVSSQRNRRRTGRKRLIVAATQSAKMDSGGCTHKESFSEDAGRIWGCNRRSRRGRCETWRLQNAASYEDAESSDPATMSRWGTLNRSATGDVVLQCPVQCDL